MPEHRPVPGSCLCGGVSFELEPPFVLASDCHCERCRKHSGNFGSASIEVPREQLRLLSGEELLGRWQPAPGLAVKVFCRRCGSSLYGTKEPEGDTVWVRLGALDGDPGLRPSRHVWVDSAPAWFPVPDDGLTRHANRPPRH
ncbi:MAG: GFA family protein [Gaiellaceae bacterium]